MFHRLGALIPGLAVLSLLGACAGRDTAAERCLDRLGSQKVDFTTATLQVENSSCKIVNPVRVTRAAMSWKPAGLLACGFASRFDEFLLDTAEPLARERLHSSIRSMRQLGTYSCRRILGSSHMSEHAKGIAIDVAGFELANGDYVSVESDWRAGNAKARFWHEFAHAACKHFSVVMTPDSNRDHHNHIHIDSGPRHSCGARAEDDPPEPGWSGEIAAEE